MCSVPRFQIPTSVGPGRPTTRPGLVFSAPRPRDLRTWPQLSASSCTCFGRKAIGGLRVGPVLPSIKGAGLRFDTRLCLKKKGQHPKRNFLGGSSLYQNGVHLLRVPEYPLGPLGQCERANANHHFEGFPILREIQLGISFECNLQCNLVCLLRGVQGAQEATAQGELGLLTVEFYGDSQAGWSLSSGIPDHCRRSKTRIRLPG